MLLSHHFSGMTEAGCDEAGRGCLAGAVFAAAVILPDDYHNERLNDSKQLSHRQRMALREEVQRDAVAWSVASVSNVEIDQINILRASILAMHRALDQLQVRPEAVIVDGNRFLPYKDLPFATIVKGDGKYLAIAAASILAKTYRDEEMLRLHALYPQYGWEKNKGYPTAEHRRAIKEYGPTPFHRMTFQLLPVEEPMLPFGDI
ncbi:MAG: ribonuclease HII [Prevotella sp.]|nr:ribonuclease HII [Prevotella sp.]